MRDVSRIDRILALVRAYWIRNPDQRFGQVLLNTAFLASDAPVPFMWNQEDDVTEKCIWFWGND